MRVARRRPKLCARGSASSTVCLINTDKSAAADELSAEEPERGNSMPAGNAGGEGGAQVPSVGNRDPSPVDPGIREPPARTSLDSVAAILSRSKGGKAT